MELTEPCEDLEGYEKFSCLQCEELGTSTYIRIVEKPAGFATINLDSLFQYGRDSIAYQGLTPSYEIAYGQDECPGDDINGYINYNNSTRSDLHTDQLFVGEFYSKHCEKFRYRVFPNGAIARP